MASTSGSADPLANLDRLAPYIHQLSTPRLRAIQRQLADVPEFARPLDEVIMEGEQFVLFPEMDELVAYQKWLLKQRVDALLQARSVGGEGGDVGEPAEEPLTKVQLFSRQVDGQPESFVMVGGQLFRLPNAVRQLTLWLNAEQLAPVQRMVAQLEPEASVPAWIAEQMA